MQNLKAASNTPEIFIIDDFYPDLEWLFPYVESQKSQKHKVVNYAGVVFPAPPLTKFAVEKIIENFRVEPLSHIGQGQIRLTTLKDQDQNQTLIHTDEGFNVVIYLSGKEDTGLGTTFYKHKELGLECFSENDPLQKKMELLFGHDTKDLKRWEITHEVPFKKNRAVFFNGRYFHSVPQIMYGTNYKDGRLTQNFFFSHKR